MPSRVSAVTSRGWLNWVFTQIGGCAESTSQSSGVTRNGSVTMSSPYTSRESVEDAHALVLNTGRVRDQWHTMTRSGRSPRLGSHLPEPFVEIHPDDAAAAGVVDG